MTQQFSQANNSKQTYQRPQLKKYGKLAELTLNTAGSGQDSILGLQFG